MLFGKRSADGVPSATMQRLMAQQLAPLTENCEGREVISEANVSIHCSGHTHSQQVDGIEVSGATQQAFASQQTDGVVQLRSVPKFVQMRDLLSTCKRGLS